MDAEEVEGVLERLRALGYVNDAEFAAAVIRARTERRARGRRLVAEELEAKGVSAEVASCALEAGYGDELEVARPVAERQARRLQGLGFAEFRQRLGAFLVRRGFEHDGGVAGDRAVGDLRRTRLRSALAAPSPPAASWSSVPQVDGRSDGGRDLFHGHAAIVAAAGDSSRAAVDPDA